MCGRFTITVDRVEFLLERFKAEPAPGLKALVPRYNAAPGQFVPAVVAKEDAKRYLTDVFWGLLPPWGEKEGKRVFQANVRDDTVAKNRFFKDRLLHNRCILLADGFYEWKLPAGFERGQKLPRGVRKTPYRIRLKDGAPFAIAGLWRTFSPGGGGEAISAALITTGPNELMSPIHDRMPVLLSDNELDMWLDPRVTDAGMLLGLLDPFPAAGMEAYRVSETVNNSRTDLPACIAPAL